MKIFLKTSKASLIVLIWANQIFAQGDTLRVIDGKGNPGTSNNIVSIYLANTVEVAAMQLDLVDNPDFLVLKSVRTTSRTAEFIQAWNDKGRVILFNLSLATISPGKGHILEMLYDVDSVANVSEIPLILENVKFADLNAEPIMPNVILVNGRFTIPNPGGSPDLVADRVYLRSGPNLTDPEVDQPVEGQQYYVFFEWRNTGSGTANSFRVENKFNGNVQCARTSQSAPANSNFVISCTNEPVTWLCPPGDSNTIQGVLDVNNAITESSEANNSVGRTFTCTHPNLIPTALTFSPASVNASNSLNLSGTVANSGNASAGNAFRVNFYLSTSPSAPDVNLLVHSFSMSALGVGQSNNFNQTDTVLANTAADSYYVWVRVDADNAIAESNETDNQLRTNTLLRVEPIDVVQSKPSVAVAPENFALLANIPNPFNPSTTIKYDLARASEVIVEIFDVLGHRVRTLVSERQQAGRYSATWDGRDEQGRAVSSGVFIYQLRAGGFAQSRKMLLLQ